MVRMGTSRRSTPTDRTNKGPIAAEPEDAVAGRHKRDSGNDRESGHKRDSGNDRESGHKRDSRDDRDSGRSRGSRDSRGSGRNRDDRDTGRDRDCRDSRAGIDREVVHCRLCPRLVTHREEVARVKRRAYRDQTYWGRPVPGFGPIRARLVLVGLAPGAHGSNRTGRMFTGDSSGDTLYRALYEHGFASQPVATSRRDGLRLIDTFITAAVRCAPPGNKPTREEFENCRPYLLRELRLLTRARIFLALGKLAFDALMSALPEIGLVPGGEAAAHSPSARRSGTEAPQEKPRFAHGAAYPLVPITEVAPGTQSSPSAAPTRPAGRSRATASADRSAPRLLLCSYHPSRQNTQTGRLTPEMFSAIFARARDELAGIAGPRPHA